MVQTDLDNATRFLRAMTRVESVLRERDTRTHNTDHHLEFKSLIENSKELVRGQKYRLKQYVDLRNAIVHDPRDDGGEAIADPRDSIVRWVEDQVDILLKPPLVKQVLDLQPPIVFEEEQDVSEFLKLVHDDSFSQAPIRTDDGVLRLITTNAITRWVASEYQAGEGVILESLKNRDIAPYSEEQDHLECRAQDLKVVDAVRLFAGEDRGNIPAAIVLTHSGDMRQRPLGICVQADVALLLQALNI